MNEADHESLRADIPEAGRGTLPAERLRRLEAHAAECSECAGVLAVAREIAALESHPAIAEVRAFARARDSARDPAIDAHVERCPSCALEVAAWRHTRSRAGHVAIAGGIVAASLLGWAWLSRVERGGFEPAAAQELVFSGALRSAEGVRTVALDPRHDLAVRAEWESLEPFDAVGLIVLEVGTPDGSVVWSERIPAERVAEILRAGSGFAGVVPAGTLAPGDYEFTLRQSSRPGEPPLILERFRVRAPDS